MEEEKKEKRVMPLGTYTRFGNFKIKRVKLLISDKGTAREENANSKITETYLEKNGLSEIEAVKIASLEELWCVRIPQNRIMYRFIIDLFEENTKDCDEILSTLLCNMSNVTSVGDGLYHDIVIHAARAYMNRKDEVSSKEDKEKEYRAIADSILIDMLKDLENYVPQKEKQEMSNKEFEQMVLADELREKLKEEKAN
ncbi:hypothetical protein [Prevotella corporis]|uniref:hypothetical protein n=1 Tax=Prevotella corporis TaxID=28128 RepID=UPI0023EF992A|nr:hypothetical protein [Prevotella corporis]